MKVVHFLFLIQSVQLCGSVGGQPPSASLFCHCFEDACLTCIQEALILGKWRFGAGGKVSQRTQGIFGTLGWMKKTGHTITRQLIARIHTRSSAGARIVTSMSVVACIFLPLPCYVCSSITRNPDFPTNMFFCPGSIATPTNSMNSSRALITPTT